MVRSSRIVHCTSASRKAGNPSPVTAKGLIPNIFRAPLDNDARQLEKWLDAEEDDFIFNVDLRRYGQDKEYEKFINDLFMDSERNSILQKRLDVKSIDVKEDKNANND